MSKVMNLDDIFGDVMFTPDGDTVFMSEQADEDLLNSGEGENVKIVCSKQSSDGRFVPVSAAGGIETTNLNDPCKEALQMGGGTSNVVPTKQAIPFKEAPQKKNQLEYAAPKKKKGKK